MSKNEFTPKWFEGDCPEKSFRSIMKWGDPKGFKHPNKRLYALMRDTFGLNDEYFNHPFEMGMEKVPENAPCKLDSKHVDALRAIVGAENLFTDVYHRLGVAYGKTMLDAMRLRKGIIENIPDVVLHPRHRADLRAIVDYCNANTIPVYIYGGGSSVTRGVEAIKGGVTLDMRVHLNKVIAFDDKNHTITVEAGMSGPELERQLRNAPELLKASRAYTCGHLPQSFEYSAVGGWVTTRGSGQNSTYYGNAADMVLAQDYVCPSGDIRTRAFPAAANGPDVDHIMIDSEQVP